MVLTDNSVRLGKNLPDIYRAVVDSAYESAAGLSRVAAREIDGLLQCVRATLVFPASNNGVSAVSISSHLGRSFG